MKLTALILLTIIFSCSDDLIERQDNYETVEAEPITREYSKTWLFKYKEAGMNYIIFSHDGGIVNITLDSLKTAYYKKQLTK